MSTASTEPLVFARLIHSSSEHGEVWIGDGDGAEFTILLEDVGLDGLSPQVRAFAEGLGILGRALEAGLGEALASEVADVEELVRRLEAVGMVDQDAPAPEAAEPECICGGGFAPAEFCPLHDGSTPPEGR